MPTVLIDDFFFDDRSNMITKITLFENFPGKYLSSIHAPASFFSLLTYLFLILSRDKEMEHVILMLFDVSYFILLE